MGIGATEVGESDHIVNAGRQQHHQNANAQHGIVDCQLRK
jgi:hypothetical protein